MTFGEPVVSGVNKEQVERLRFIFSTPKGSVPLERDFGIDFDVVDMPMEMSKGKLTEEFIVAARKYIGATISVTFEQRDELITPRVVIK